MTAPLGDWMETALPPWKHGQDYWSMAEQHNLNTPNHPWTTSAMHFPHWDTADGAPRDTSVLRSLVDSFLYVCRLQRFIAVLP